MKKILLLFSFIFLTYQETLAAIADEKDISIEARVAVIDQELNQLVFEDEEIPYEHKETYEKFVVEQKKHEELWKQSFSDPELFWEAEHEKIGLRTVATNYILRIVEGPLKDKPDDFNDFTKYQEKNGKWYKVEVVSKSSEKERDYVISTSLFPKIQKKFPFIVYDPVEFSNPEGIDSMSHMGFAPQGAGLIVNELATYPLCTNFLGNCTGIAAYNPRTKHRFLAHILSFTSSDNFEKILKALEKVTGETPKDEMILAARTSWINKFSIGFVEALRKQGYNFKLTASQRFSGSRLVIATDLTIIPRTEGPTAIDQHRALALTKTGEIVPMIHKDTAAKYPYMETDHMGRPITDRPEGVTISDWDLYNEIHEMGVLEKTIKNSARVGLVESLFFY